MEPCARGCGHKKYPCALGRPGDDDKGSTGRGHAVARTKAMGSDRHTLATTTNAVIVSSFPGKLIKC